MSVNSLWLVPDDQAACTTRVWEIAERLWERGFIPMLDLDSKELQGRRYDYFRSREEEWNASGRSLPEGYRGGYDTVWITYLAHRFLVPASAHLFCDLRCPCCHKVVAPTVDSPAGGAFGRTVGAIVRCRQCGKDFPGTEIEYDPSQVAWTCFSISFHDVATCEIPVSEPWVREAIAVIGTSRQFRGWET
jgi:hypothetical protein